MPTFRTQRPRGISESVRSLVSSSPRLSADERISIERAAAEIDQRQSLAEKARLEIEQERAAARRREDPALALEYGARAAMLDLPRARQYESWRQNPMTRPSTETDELGTRMPDIRMESPLSAEEGRAYDAARASLIANQLATGKTNAEQLTGGGGNLLVQAIRNQISAPDTDLPTANRLAQAAGVRTREPFRMNPQGVVLNEETGAVDEGSQLAQVVREATKAQATQRTAAGGLSDARSRAVTNPPPRPAPARTEAQEARDRAYAARAQAAVDRERAAQDNAKQARVRRTFTTDPNMRGKTLGRWIEGQGFEVKDATGRLVGYYD